jgi:hypothetical protein
VDIGRVWLMAAAAVVCNCWKVPCGAARRPLRGINWDEEEALVAMREANRNAFIVAFRSVLVSA